MRRTTCLVLLLAALATGGDDELEGIARRLDSAEPSVRETAQAELDAWCEGHTDAAEQLSARMAGASAEAKALLEAQVAFLARVEECRKYVAILDGLGLPSVADKTWVSYNLGDSDIYGIERKRLVFSRARGWILSESEQEIEVLEDNLWRERRTRRRDLPERWEEFKATVPEGTPRPGEYVELDFERYCVEFLKVTPDDWFSWLDFTREETDCSCHTGARACLLAYWALQRKRPRLAVRLFDHATASFGEAAKQAGSTMAPSPSLAGSLATTLRWQAQWRANQGAPREELVERWNLALRLPENEWTAEAKEMIAAYEAMIEEDRGWRALSPEDVAALDVETQAEYWIHELRDLGAKQMSQPGYCIVAGPFSGIPKDRVNPVDKLIEIGWDAIPHVIAHLDDRRPTRSLGWCRSHWVSTYWVLRYGDCCKSAFSSITGVGIYTPGTTSGYMVRDGKAAQAKARAEDWWKENGGKGRDAYFVGVLENGPPGRQSGAAYRLLRTDAAKYLPLVLETASKTDNPARGALLDELRPYLAKEHASFVSGFLEENDLETVVLAAGILWDRCGSPGGTERVIEMIDAKPIDWEPYGFELHRGLEVVARTCTEASVQAYLRWLKWPAGRRKDTIERAGALRDPRIGEVLSACLDDRSSTGWTTGSENIRWCDVAATSLGLMLLREPYFDQSRPRAERDANIAELKAWWSEHHDTIDWAALRAKAAEPRKGK